MKKWIGISLGSLLGITHIGLIGTLTNRTSFPKLNLPIGEYTSYNVVANKEGYSIIISSFLIIALIILGMEYYSIRHSKLIATVLLIL